MEDALAVDALEDRPEARQSDEFTRLDAILQGMERRQYRESRGKGGTHLEVGQKAKRLCDENASDGRPLTKAKKICGG